MKVGDLIVHRNIVRDIIYEVASINNHDAELKIKSSVGKNKMRKVFGKPTKLHKISRKELDEDYKSLTIDYLDSEMEILIAMFRPLYLKVLGKKK